MTSKVRRADQGCAIEGSLQNFNHIKMPLAIRRLSRVSYTSL